MCLPLTLAATIECVHMLNIRISEAIPLTKLIQTDPGVDRFDGGLSVARECESTVMHDGACVVGNSLGGHEGSGSCFEIIFKSCNWITMSCVASYINNQCMYCGIPNYLNSQTDS